MDLGATFQILDYVILVSVLVASLAIGVYFACFGGKQRTTKEYFKGDRKMNMLPVVLSMMASFISSNGMLGVPAEVYYYGFNYWYTCFGAFVGIPVAIFGFMPVFYRLQVTSVFEYLERRFNKLVRRFGSIMYSFTLLTYASFVTYGPALALSQVTGLSVWGSILTTTSIGTIYTSIGGIKAVMWTDSMQLMIFTGALLATVIKGLVDAGGISPILERAIDGERLGGLSFSPDPRVRFTFWGIMISSCFGWMQGYSTSQLQVQRYLSCPDKKRARRSIWMNVPGMIIVNTIYCFVGLMLYAMYYNCDPYTSQQIEQPDQIFPLFVMHTMSSIPGMSGIFVAGVYCASLSTTSSVLNSLAAITLEDHVKPHWKGLTDEKATHISKLIAVGYGFLCIAMIAAIMNLGSILQAIYYMDGGTNGATFGLFTLGMMNPWATPKGSIIGVIWGLGMAWWVSIGNQIYRPPPNSPLPLPTTNCSDILGEWDPRPTSNTSGDEIFDLYKISYFWVMPLAYGTTVLIGSICSLFIGNNENLDMKLYSPLVLSVLKKFFPNKYEELRKKYKQTKQDIKDFTPMIDVVDINYQKSYELVKEENNYQNSENKVHDYIGKQIIAQ